jgi:anti-sigma regulatory factor (Ser/Thr protein kinase)
MMAHEMTEWRPLDLELPASESAPMLARAAANAVLAELPPEREADVELLLSEVVTNAIRHCDLGERDVIDLRLGVEAGIVRAEVWDRGGGFDPDQLTPPGDGVGGWGLRIVDELADRWDVEIDDGWTCVWFELRTRPSLRSAPPIARQAAS